MSECLHVQDRTCLEPFVATHLDNWETFSEALNTSLQLAMINFELQSVQETMTDRQPDVA